MVEFCIECKSSLPKADVTIVDGQVYASHDYECPFCRKSANPAPNKPYHAPAFPDPSDAKDVLIRNGSSVWADPPPG